MSQATGKASRRAVGRVLGCASAAVLFAAVAFIQPQVANADDGGGSHHRSGHFRAVFGFGGIFPPFFWWGYDFPFDPFYDYGNYPDHRNYNYDPGSSYYGNPDSGYGSQRNARQTWYYCPKPAGYYPRVAHCNTVWQYGPGSANSAAPPHG